MKRKIIGIILILFLPFCLYGLNYVDAEEFPKNLTFPSSKNFKDLQNEELGIKIKYPENWTIQYTTGKNYSKIISPESVNLECYFVRYCSLIDDIYLQIYLLDLTYYLPVISIFDYLPSIRILSPIQNYTDNFVENVKIATFQLPNEISLEQFIYYYQKYYEVRMPIDIENSCQSDPLANLLCVINYTFTAGNNIEKTNYRTFQIFIEDNNKIYLFSYNALAETYSNYIEIFKMILDSFRPL